MKTPGGAPRIEVRHPASGLPAGGYGMPAGTGVRP